MRQHQRRTAAGLDHLGHRERLAGAGDAEQNLVLLAILEAAHKGVDGGRLIAPRLIVDSEPEGHYLQYTRAVYNALAALFLTQ